MLPAEWPADPAKEWCPPGHGDIYATLMGSGKLDELLSSTSHALALSVKCMDGDLNAALREQIVAAGL